VVVAVGADVGAAGALSVVAVVVADGGAAADADGAGDGATRMTGLGRGGM
jgi:hypothetical protein